MQKIKIIKCICIPKKIIPCARNTKGGSITVPLTSCLTGLDQPVLQIKTKIVSFHTADSKPVKQEVNGIVILPPLVRPDLAFLSLGTSIALWTSDSRIAVANYYDPATITAIKSFMVEAQERERQVQSGLKGEVSLYR